MCKVRNCFLVLIADLSAYVLGKSIALIVCSISSSFDSSIGIMAVSSKLLPLVSSSVAPNFCWVHFFFIFV